MGANSDHDKNGDRLLISAKEAAAMLGMSRKALWRHTAPRGACIPCVHVGRFLRYSRATLERWIAEQERAAHGNATG
jgi:predicted DNA-binding transcriptional regulator AlpA